MFEHKSQPLAPKPVYISRIGRSFAASLGILVICLALGTVGFRYTVAPHPAWIDCLHNAAMLLGGMGPVLDPPIQNVNGKLFSSFYALFSGVAFITNIGILMAPAVHRFFHRMHMEP
jgi:hypothetical protein